MPVLYNAREPNSQALVLLKEETMSFIRRSMALAAFAALFTTGAAGVFAQIALPVSVYTSTTQSSLASGISDNGVISGAVEQTKYDPPAKGGPARPVDFFHAAKWTLSGGSYTFLDLGQLKPDGNNNGRWVSSWANSIIDTTANTTGVAIVGNSHNGGGGSSTHANTPPAFYWPVIDPMKGPIMASLTGIDTVTYFTWAYAIVLGNGTDQYIFGSRERNDLTLENGGLHNATYWVNGIPDGSPAYLQNLSGTGEKWADALGSNGTIVVGRACEDDMTMSPRAVYWPTISSAPISVGKPTGMTGSYSQLKGVKSVTISGTTHAIAVGATSNSLVNNSAYDQTYLSGGLGAYAYDITTSSSVVLPTPIGGYSTACAVAINTSGIIVGSAYKQAVDGNGMLLFNLDGTPMLIEYACKWTPNGLGSYPSSGAAFLSAGSSFSRLIRATGINSSGTIVGLGDISSVVRAFVLY